MFKKYTVIIGDLVKSKEIKNRKKVQRQLKTILKSINNIHSSKIVSNFMITLGDEFQGVLKSLDQSYNIVSEIQEAFDPKRLRFGIGWGKISTRIYKKAIGMDGPAFHTARQVLDLAKRKERNILYYTRNIKKDNILNTLLYGISELKEEPRLLVAGFEPYSRGDIIIPHPTL